jgi:O-antigen/teichoic acid export membrane protein
MPQLPHPIHSLKAQLAFNTTSQIIGRIVSSLTTFIVTLVLAKTFGAQGFGDYVKITTYVAFFYLLADFGINAMYLQQEKHWEDLLVLRIIMSCVLVLGALGVLYLLPKGVTQGYTDIVRMGIILLSPTIAFQAIITSCNALFQKYLRYDMSTIAIIVGSVTSLILLFIVMYQHIFPISVIFPTTVLLVSAGVTAITALFLTRNFENIKHTHLSFLRAWTLFCASIPLGLTLLFNLVYFRIDNIILTLTRSTMEVGVYGLAYKVFELPLIFPTFFMNALYPVLLKEQKDSLKKLIKKSLILLFVSSLIVTGGLWIAAPLVGIIKQDFVLSITALRVLSLGLPFFFVSSLMMWVLIAQKKQNILLVIYGISMVINICLNYFFIPVYGYMAAAWITVVSEAIVLCMSGITVAYILHKHV